MLNLLFCLMGFFPNTKAQSLLGTTWHMTIPAVSAKPFHLVFGMMGNKGSLLRPDKTLNDFTWTENNKGQWKITVE